MGRLVGGIRYSALGLAALLVTGTGAGVVASGELSPAARLLAVPSTTSPGGDAPALADPATYTDAALGVTTPLAGAAPRWGRLLHPVAAADPATAVDVTLSLVGRDDSGLRRFAQQVYAAGSPAYHQYLTPDEYDVAFGAEPARSAAAARWLRDGGLRVDYTSGSGTVLQARGTLAAISRRFGVRFATFSAGGHRFLSATGTPRVPDILGVRGVQGLDRFPYVTPLLAAPVSESTSPPDLWKLYDQPARDAGQGQSLATFSWGAPNWGDGKNIETDLRAFEAGNHLPAMPFTEVQVGTPGTDLSGIDEWALDAEASSGMAYQASHFTMYFATDGVNPYNAIQAWADDPHGSLQASASFGECESLLVGSGVLPTADATFEQAALEGRTVFVSSGDTGAGCSLVANVVNTPLLDVEYPASSPWVVAVGGTVVTEDQHTSALSEYAWNGSGGGLSTQEPAQPWDRGMVSTAPGSTVPATPPCALLQGAALNTGLAPCRPVPDVAAQSGDLLSGYNVVADGTSATIAGTSLAAPLWQGMWARVQALAPAGRHGRGLGFADPALYALYQPVTAGAPNGYTRSFNDVTVGDNGPYPSTPGYDYVTGLGSPDVTGLIASLDGPHALAGAAFAPPPPAVALSRPCRSGPQIVAPAGHTANLLGSAVGPNPAPGDPDVTLRSTQLSYSTAHGGVLTAAIRVQGLSANPQGDPGSVGDQFQQGFTVDNTAYVLIAQRETVDAAGNLNPTPAETFELGLFQPGGFATVLDSGLSGSFDPARSTVTIRLPEATFDRAVRSQHIAATSLSGARFTALSALSFYDYGEELQQADQLGTACSYTAPGVLRAVDAGVPLKAKVTAGSAFCADGKDQITGQPGQATQLVLVDDGQPALSQDDLDVLGARLTWNPRTALLTARIRVQNLSASPPNGMSTQENFRYDFTDRGAWELSAARTATGTKFSVANVGVSGTSVPVTGSFDPGTNTVTVVMPARALVSVGGPQLHSGDVLTGMTVLGQRYAGVLTLTADSVTGSCNYRLP